MRLGDTHPRVAFPCGFAPTGAPIDTLTPMPVLTKQGAVANPFERVSLDQRTITPEQLNLAGRQRTNPFPWRGQFSPELIELLLSAYGPSTGTVLDPFAGVGTTLWESARRRLDAVGTEINPAAVTMAESLRFVPLNDGERKAALSSARSRLARLATNRSAGPLFRGIGDPTDQSDGCAKRLVVEAVRAAGDDLERIALANILLRAMEANPTDPAERLFGAFDSYAAAVMALPCSTSNVTIHHADSRNVPIADGTIDLVLTSPPYINVFNYHQNGRVAMEALGWDLLSVARSEFGANRKHRGNRLLTVIQYALDMTQWLSEMRRVLSPMGRMIVIIGRESTVRGVAFKNGMLLAVLAEAAGYTLGLRQERQFVTRFGEPILEDILHFQITGEPEADANDTARAIAVSFLYAATQSQLPHDVAADVQSAIAESSAVRPSPILQPARSPCPTR